MLRRIISMVREQGLGAALKHAWASMSRSPAASMAVDAFAQGGGGVLLISGCPGASFRYRAQQPGEQLVAEADLQALALPVGGLRLKKAIIASHGIMLHRVAWSASTRRLMRIAKARQIPIVFDTDDRVVHPDHVDAFLASRGELHVQGARANYRRYFSATAKTLAACDAVTASTEPLALEVSRLFRDKDVRLLLNTPTDEMLHAGAAAHAAARAAGLPEFELGYFSGTRTHDRDLAECADAICAAFIEHRTARLLIVGPVQLPEQLQQFAERIEHHEALVPHVELPAQLVRAGIHLAPLCADDGARPFVEGKSQVKWFESGAVSRMVIASSVGEVAKSIDPGVDGEVCATPTEWRECLLRLLGQPEQVAACGVKARQRVEAWAQPNRAANLDTMLELFKLKPADRSGDA